MSDDARSIALFLLVFGRRQFRRDLAGRHTAFAAVVSRTWRFVIGFASVFTVGPLGVGHGF